MQTLFFAFTCIKILVLWRPVSCVKVINISLFLIQMCPCLGQVQLITPAGWSSRSGGIHWQIINTLSYDLTVNWLVHTMPATAFRTIHLLSAYQHICGIHDMGSYYIEVMTPRCGYHKCAISTSGYHKFVSDWLEYSERFGMVDWKLH